MSKYYRTYYLSLNDKKEAFIDIDPEGLPFYSPKVDIAGKVLTFTSAVPYRINLANLDFHRDLLFNLRTLTNGKYCDFDCKYHRYDLFEHFIIPRLELCNCPAFHRSDSFIELEIFKCENGF